MTTTEEMSDMTAAESDGPSAVIHRSVAVFDAVGLTITAGSTGDLAEDVRLVFQFVDGDGREAFMAVHPDLVRAALGSPYVIGGQMFSAVRDADRLMADRS